MEKCEIHSPDKTHLLNHFKNNIALSNIHQSKKTTKGLPVKTMVKYLANVFFNNILTFDSQIIKPGTMKTNEFKKGAVFSFDASIDYAPSAIVSKHILKKKTGNISLFAFGEGEGLSEHTAPFDALVYVVDGKTEVQIAGKKHLLDKGTSILMPANIPHALYAPEDFKMVLVMIRD
jgi:quercetin dioxygenase-like cupin family protein